MGTRKARTLKQRLVNRDFTYFFFTPPPFFLACAPYTDQATSLTLCLPGGVSSVVTFTEMGAETVLTFSAVYPCPIIIRHTPLTFMALGHDRKMISLASFWEVGKSLSTISAHVSQ